MTGKKLEIQLFGGFFCRWEGGDPIEIRGVKHRALMAILATAANGTHSRSWIQETLWALSGEELGRSSLRRALSDIRKIFGDSFDSVFHTNNIDVQMNLERINLIGSPRDGLFLDGLSLPEKGFERWLAEKRRQHKPDFGAQLLAARMGVAPKIAVLPFLSRQRVDEETHLADLLAMEVSRCLSRSRLLDVISHLSSRRLDTRAMDLDAMRDILGFDYVVYGNVLVRDQKYRFEADLAEADTGHIIWSEGFSGNIADLLSGQANVIAELAGRIGQGILKASVELAQSGRVDDIASHALLMSSVTLMHGHKQNEFMRAQSYLEELIRRTPDKSLLHAWLAKWHMLAAHQGWTASKTALGLAVDSAARALDHDPHCAFSLAVDGMVNSHTPGREDAVSERFQESLNIDPNNPLAWLLYSRHHTFQGDGETALTYADRACMLSPCDPHQYFFDLLRACAKSVCGDYEGALELSNASLKANPRHMSTLRTKTVALSMLGRDAEARIAADELLRWEPDFTIQSYLKNHPAGADKDMPRLWADALSRAGVPKT